MPLLHVYLAEGNSTDQKQKLMLALTDAVEQTIGAKRQAIRVMLHEFPRQHFMAGGVIPPELSK
jgi:4-oxalocrotonate tautomerase